jgi:hypothetical protein
MSFRLLPTAYKLVKFAEAKRFNDVTIIANETGYSSSHVSNVLYGRRNNELVHFRLRGLRRSLLFY